MKKLHIGIIMDGNRRFSKKILKQPWIGHKYGAEKLKNVFDWAKEFNIKELTFYALSMENFKRPKKEFDFLMKLFKKEAENLKKDESIHKDKIKIRFIGKKEMLDKELQEKMNELENLTKNYSNYIINIAIAYGGKQEILSAVKKLVENKQEINEKNFKKNLWLKDEPDLIIRTGGEKRTSNFLLWQAAYSEWIFLDKMWPELTKKDFENCINEFKKRQRRFGK